MPDLYEKDGQQRLAYTPTEAVDLRFQGYKRVAADVDPEATATEDVAEPADDVTPAPVPPPLTGAGSDTEAWLDYAAGLGLTFEGEPKRADVIKALRVAGHPTEAPAAE